mmetsp:Transcript_24465/g.56745  ORF Transcript_24465/g.56745 Transcript_24465/m.56745 type:complete len:476 (+) Transcript_24465:62-1489(+)
MRAGLLAALAVVVGSSWQESGTGFGKHEEEPYDCDAGAANAKLGWSHSKQEYCCKNHHKGCAQLPSPVQEWPAKNAEVEDDHTHMVPPWWIVAGIKPAGETVDYGPYTAAGFSRSQQQQYGVNATGHVENFHRFHIATKALQPCIDPHEKQMGLDQQDMMHLLGHVLEDAWEEITEDDPALREWTRLRSSCQQECMTNVLSWSLRTLWSTGELLSRGGGTTFSSALADAVRACYPGFRALRADEVAKKVGKIVARGLEAQLPLAAARGDFTSERKLSFKDLNQNPSCLAPSDSDAEDRHRFVVQLEMAVEKAVKTAETRSWSTMEQAARPCQQTCRRAVMKQAAQMLWDAGLLARGNADMLVMTSIQGGLAACLTNLPADASEALAGEAMLHMRPPGANAPGRTLLSRNPLRLASAREEVEGLRFAALPLASFALAAAALLALLPLARLLLRRLRNTTLVDGSESPEHCVEAAVE